MSAEAKSLPARSHGWFRTWFRKVWKIRGGGLYACGFAISFLIFETISIVDDVKEVGLLFDGQIIQFILNFVIDSFKNTVRAFMWPVEVIRLGTPWGPIALGLAFAVFPSTLKKPIERWLFADEPDVTKAEAEEDVPTSSQ